MLLIILTNMIFIVMSYMNLSEEWVAFLDLVDQIFMYIFVAEAVFKIAGLGPQVYFRDNWNKFDFGLVVSSLCIDVTNSVLKVAKNLRTAKSLKIVSLSKS